MLWLTAHCMMSGTAATQQPCYNFGDVLNQPAGKKKPGWSSIFSQENIFDIIWSKFDLQFSKSLLSTDHLCTSFSIQIKKIYESNLMQHTTRICPESFEIIQKLARVKYFEVWGSLGTYCRMLWLTAHCMMSGTAATQQPCYNFGDVLNQPAGKKEPGWSSIFSREVI